MKKGFRWLAAGLAVLLGVQAAAFLPSSSASSVFAETIDGTELIDDRQVGTVHRSNENVQVTLAQSASESELADAATSGQLGDYVIDAADPDWTISKSIHATNLDKNFNSEITLSLPSEEEQLVSEICFVLDKSRFSATKEPALQMLSMLKNAADQNNSRIKVDIIGFNRAAIDAGSYDLSSQYEEIEEAFSTEAHGGTNMHAGLLKAEEVLAEDTSIPDSRKYMILVSDGDTYLYCKNGDYTTYYSRAYSNSKEQAYGGYYDEVVYNPSKQENNVHRPTTSDAEEWTAYFQDVVARNQESQGDSYDFIWYYYDHDWVNKTLAEIQADGFRTQPKVPRSASNMDMAFLNAASVYHELASRYHCYAMAVPSWNTVDGGHEAFMDYLNDGAKADFEDIGNEILYFLGAGSYIDDYISYDNGNFDLTDPTGMTVTVDNTETGDSVTYSAQKIGENHYGFGPEINSGKYSYEILYTPGDKGENEHFRWTMNVPASNFAHVTLRYTVQLQDPEETPGYYYGDYDADGTGGKEKILVATDGSSAGPLLHYVLSDGTYEGEENFDSPVVTYTIPAVKKLAKDTGGPLQGVSFTLTGTSDAGEAYDLQATTGADGIGVFSDENGARVNLTQGTYTLHEVQAVSGYQLAPDVTLSVGEDGTITAGGEAVENATVTVTDEKETADGSDNGGTAGGDSGSGGNSSGGGSGSGGSDSSTNSLRPAVIDPPIRKVIAGDIPPADSTFTFVLEADEAGYPMPSGSSEGVKTITITGGNSAEFGDIYYDTPGTYTYTCYEMDDDIAGYVNDTARFTLKVVVTRSGNTLSADRTIVRNDGQEVSEILFTNYYSASSDGDDADHSLESAAEEMAAAADDAEHSAESELRRKPVPTGDDSLLPVYVCLTVLSAAALVRLAFLRRKSR